MNVPPELPALLLGAAAMTAAASSLAATGERTRLLARQLAATRPAMLPRGPRGWAGALARLLSPSLLDAERRRIGRAGLPLAPEQLIAIRILVVGAVSCGASLAFLMTRSGARFAGLAASAGAVVGFSAGEWWLASRTKYAAARLRSEWPGLLSRLRLCLAAGMSAEAALESINLLAQRHEPRLGVQLSTVVAQMHAGLAIDRAIALWADSTGVAEVRVLADALERSRRTGVGVGVSVEGQHRAAVNRRRQAYLSWLSALPSRLSTVAMVFFLPAVLVVVLMPSVLAFLRAGW